MNEPDSCFSTRIGGLKPSCIREILKTTENQQVISFAGGLPNPKTFPVRELAEIAGRLLRDHGSSLLQYSTTEGYLPLREFVAERLLRPRGITASAEEILITSGSQQALDLIGKVFLNPGDRVLLESPSYLSAIQAFALYQPEFHSIPTDDEGLCLDSLDAAVKAKGGKMLYAIPTFQNPTGLCYSEARREVLREWLYKHPLVFVEDDPYREIRFSGTPAESIVRSDHPCALLTSSLSKLVSPGFRLGWIYAPERFMGKLVLAKQASDLCTGMFTQRILYEWLKGIDLNERIRVLGATYRRQRDAMIRAIRSYFPEGISFTEPEGGMFIWVTMPRHISAKALLQRAVARGVVFAPGYSFYADRDIDYTMRLNFSHAEEDQIDRGMKILAEEIRAVCA